MKKLSALTLGLLINIFVLTAYAHTKGVVNFDQLGFTDFDQVGTAIWGVENNVIVSNTGNGFLVTKNTYENFHLKLEFMADEGTNSGIFFRCNSSTTINDQNCYEANIFDTRPDQKYRTGGVTHFASPKALINTEDGLWHSYEIIAQGTSFRIILDGQETVMMRDEKLSSGPIALQFAMGGIKFRNIKVSELIEQEQVQTPVDGVWELESFILTDANGKTSEWCEGSYGVIMYTQGYMSTAVNCLKDVKKALLYSGRFEYKNDSVTHYATNYNDPLLNRAFQRSVVMKDEEHLELRGELPGGVTASVKWIRR